MTLWIPSDHEDMQEAVGRPFRSAVYLSYFTGVDPTGATSSLTAFTTAYNAAVATGGRLVIGDGIYNLTGLAITISGNVILEGNPGRTILDFGLTTPTSTAHFSFAAGASVVARGLHFRNAGYIFRPPNNVLVEEIRIEGCRFQNIASVAYRPSVDADAASNVGVKRFYCLNSRIDGAKEAGIQLRPPVMDFAMVTGCEVTNSMRCAILLGGGAAPSQENRGRFTIIGNRVKGVTGDGSGTGGAVGIQCFGDGATIIGNHVSDTESSDGTDCEGIYTKVRNAIITGNVLYNSGSTQGAIAIKGTNRQQNSTGAFGYGTTVANNQIRFPDNFARSVAGIWVQEGDIQIVGNYIEGTTLYGIAVESDQRDRVQIRDNHIYNHRGPTGIHCENNGTGLVISGNLLNNINNGFAATSTVMGINVGPVVNAAARTLTQIKIAGNQITGLSGSATIRGIRINSAGANVTVSVLAILDNQVISAGDGIVFTTTGAVTDVWLNGNMVRATGTAVVNSAGVTSLASGRNTYAAGVAV